MADEVMTLEQVRDRLRQEYEMVERDSTKYPENAYHTDYQTLDELHDAVQSAITERDTLRTELAAAKAGWQPIETAPRDGTEILLLFPEERVLGGIPLPRVRAAKWVSYPWEDKASANWNIPMWPDLRPTGWQPLPPPPGAHP